MEVSTITTAGSNSLLREMRAALQDADEALLCVAFLERKGVHLLGRQLGRLGHATRLLVTTTFKNPRAAFRELHRLGTRVSLHNPGSGTYHPKVYLARSGPRVKAIIGSANLTGGLASNVEAAVLLDGTLDDAPIGAAWDWATRIWDDTRNQPWDPASAAGAEDEDRFDPDLGLQQLLEQAVAARNGVITTLGSTPRTNHVKDINPAGILVETDRSRAQGSPPQLIPAWMFELAWEVLRSHGTLSNSYLLDVLHVHRSSAVCALLATLPGVTVVPGRIELRWTPPDPAPSVAPAPVTALAHSVNAQSAAPPAEAPLRQLLSYPTLRAAAGALQGDSEGEPPPGEVVLPVRSRSERLFAVRASGDSMDGGPKPIRDGDWLVLRPLDDVGIGAVRNRVALIAVPGRGTGEAYQIKRVVKRGSRWQLVSDNPRAQSFPAHADTRPLAELIELVHPEDLAPPPGTQLGEEDLAAPFRLPEQPTTGRRDGHLFLCLSAAEAAAAFETPNRLRHQGPAPQPGETAFVLVGPAQQDGVWTYRGVARFCEAEGRWVL